MALTLTQARSVYDRIGRGLDWQAFYEDAATDQLVANAALNECQTIFEFGCGTGRLAARLLGELPENVEYLGVDLSPVMVNLTTNRLTPWGQRAQAVLVDGSLPLPARDGYADRVLSTFVYKCAVGGLSPTSSSRLPAEARSLTGIEPTRLWRDGLVCAKRF